MSYDQAFFETESRVALAAAEIVLPDVLKRTGAQSVVDVGCGTGAWLSVAKREGCRVLGVDFDVPAAQLLIADVEFTRVDLTEIAVHTDYDLALCLEVGEHLPESRAAALVAGLCSARFVLWSAAIPGQGGVGHCNEQWASWWERLFAEHGYVASRDVMQEHWNDRRIADFYRQNIILYSTLDRLLWSGYIVKASPLSDLIHPDLAKAKGW